MHHNCGETEKVLEDDAIDAEQGAPVLAGEECRKVIS